jgi:hypothetical protein
MAHIPYPTWIRLDPDVVQMRPRECEPAGIGKPPDGTAPGVRAADVPDGAMAELWHKINRRPASRDDSRAMLAASMGNR